MAIKILFLAANPIDTEHLRLDAEMRSIDLAVRQAEFRDHFDIQSHWALRIDDLQELLLRHMPNIVHFSGHGSDNSEIILQDERGQSAIVPAKALNNLFKILKDNIQCVVLNACFSAEQSIGIAETIDCVVGMPGEISDSASIKFATAFYRALGYGRDIKTAFNLGCNYLDFNTLGESYEPRLLGNADPTTIRFTDTINLSSNLPEFEPNSTSASILEVQFPYAISCQISRQERLARINRIELKNGGNTMVDAGWRGKIAMLRQVDFRVTLIDTIVLPAIPPGGIIPIGPFTVDVPRDIIQSTDEWHLELYVIDPHGSEELLFRSPQVSF